MKRLLKIFLTGVTTLLPSGFTIFLLYWVFSTIDSFTGRFITKVTGKEFIGLGFLVSIGIIFFIGLIMQMYIGQKVVKYLESLLHKIPIANLIFKASHELISSVVSESKSAFSDSVLVMFPNENVSSFGFITKKNIMVNGELKHLVFIPTTPNPTSGFLTVVNPDHLTYLDIKPDEAMKIVISLGINVPNKFKEGI